MKSTQLFRLVSVSFLLCSSGAFAAEQYTDWDATIHFVTPLEQQFDAICGDTFCSGVYGNLRSLGLECTIDRGKSKIGACIWSFAGTNSEIDVETGAIKVYGKTFACNLGVNGMAVAEVNEFFVGATAEGSPGQRVSLHNAILPHSDKTLMDILNECL